MVSHTKIDGLDVYLRTPPARAKRQAAHVFPDLT